MPEISEMSLGGNFGVAVRVRPGDASLKSCVKINGNTVSVADERHGLKGDKSFAFDRVFDGSTRQEEVFAEVAATVDAVPDGVHIPRPSPFTPSPDTPPSSNPRISRLHFCVRSHGLWYAPILAPFPRYVKPPQKNEAIALS